MSENLLDELLAPALAEMDPTHVAVVEAKQQVDLEVEFERSTDHKLLAEKLRFVSASDVNSFIGYRLSQHTYKGKPYLNYDLILGSCDRQIQWHGEDVEKIDAAIAVMESLRNALLEHGNEI
jgi:hypothetical protein